MLLALVFVLMNLPAFAGTIQVLPAGPMVADGETTLRVSMVVPGLAEADKVRVRGVDGTVSAVTRGPGGVVTVHFVPVLASEPRDAKLAVSVRGEMKLDEEVAIPVLAPPKGKINVSFEPNTWKAGSAGTVKVSLAFEGVHPLPTGARALALDASDGKISNLTREADGRWTATWTPPAKPTDPANVLFTATDLTAPEEVHGYGALPMLVEREYVAKAPPDTQNILVIGPNQYGPAPSTPQGEVKLKVMLDPRVTSGTLQSVDMTARRTDSTVTLESGAKAQLRFAPIPERLPTNTPVVVWLALLQPDGRPWADVAPQVSGVEGRVEGDGWYSFRLTTPSDPGPWTVEATAGTLRTSVKVNVVDNLPELSVSANPPSLKEGQNTFAVTVGLKDSRGKALVKRKPTFAATGAVPVGAFKDNGDGTYTQQFKLDKNSEGAAVTVHASNEGLGLPVRRVVLWTNADSVVADGSSTVELRAVALDAYGLPVPNVELAISAPLGDGNLPPTVKTDKFGMVALSYRAGTAPGPAAIRAEAKGVVGEVLLWQIPSGANAVIPEPVGEAPQIEAAARWRGAAPRVNVGRLGADVGPPAVVAITTIPNYTTPGAAILVNLRVLDAAGKAVPDATPGVTSSIGTVGKLTNNGDGTYTLALQLPPGQDGPVSLQVVAGAAQGALALPTLATLGSASVDDGSGETGGREGGGREGGGNRPQSDAPVARVRFSLFDAGFNQTLSCVDCPEDSEVPSTAGVGNFLPIGAVGAALSAEFFPNGGAIGLDLRGRAGLYPLEIAGEKEYDAVYPVVAGLRYRYALQDGLYAWGGGWFQAVDLLGFRYTDITRTGATTTDHMMLGARVGGGLQIEKSAMGFRLEVAETFAPLPALSHASLNLDAVVSEAGDMRVIGSFSVEGEYVHTRFPITDTEREVKARGPQVTVMAGAGVAF